MLRIRVRSLINPHHHAKPDPHQSEKRAYFGAVEAHNEAIGAHPGTVDGLKLRIRMKEKPIWFRIKVKIRIRIGIK